MNNPNRNCIADDRHCSQKLVDMVLPIADTDWQTLVDIVLPITDTDEKN